MLRGTLDQHIPEQGTSLLSAGAVVAQVERLWVGIFRIVLSGLFAEGFVELELGNEAEVVSEK